MNHTLHYVDTICFINEIEGLRFCVFEFTIHDFSPKPSSEIGKPIWRGRSVGSAHDDNQITPNPKQPRKKKKVLETAILFCDPSPHPPNLCAASVFRRNPAEPKASPRGPGRSSPGDGGKAAPSHLNGLAQGRSMVASGRGGDGKPPSTRRWKVWLSA